MVTEQKKLTASAIGAFSIVLLYALIKVFIPNLNDTAFGIMLFFEAFIVAYVGMSYK